MDDADGDVDELLMLTTGSSGFAGAIEDGEWVFGSWGVNTPSSRSLS